MWGVSVGVALAVVFLVSLLLGIQAILWRCVLDAAYC